MKKIFYALSLYLFFTTTTFAQQLPITIKDNVVLLNGSAIMIYQKANYSEFSFYNLQGEEVLVYFIKRIPITPKDDQIYVLINFLKEEVKLVTALNNPHIYTTAFSSKDTKRAEKLLNWLFEAKVILPDGSFDPEKVQAFYRKYNDDILEKSLNH